MADKYVNQSEVVNRVKNKENFYDAMLRNGFVMPKLKSSICTLEWMQQVSVSTINKLLSH